MGEALLYLFGAISVYAVATGIAERSARPSAAFRLTWPYGADAAQTTAAFRAMTGLLPPWWRRFAGIPRVVFEVYGTKDGIEHILIVSESSASYVLGKLNAAIPGMRAERVRELRRVDLTHARELVRRRPGPLRVGAAADVAAGLLAALQPLRAGELIALQYVVAPVAQPRESWLDRLTGTSAERPARRTPEEPVLAAAVRVGVVAEEPARAGQLIARAIGSFHALGTSDGELRRRVLPSALVRARFASLAAPARRRTLRADELAAAAALPLGGPQVPGLILSGSRVLPPNARIAQHGLVLGDAVATEMRRPVALDLTELRRGLHVCAPTGAGKSTLLVHIATQLINAGESLVVIESKGDLIAELVDRVPVARAGDVIVFDPADRDRPVGFNLIGGAEDADLIVDHVVGQFRARYGTTGLGPRSEDILRAALLTLATEPGQYTLCEVEPLLTNAAFRQRLVGKLEEPVLEGFWSWFSSLSDAARAEAVAPLANKLRTYTLRPRLRAVIGQPNGLDLASVLAERRILLVSLAKGLVGEDAAALLGGAMVSRLWTAIMARAGLPAAARPPATIVCDEFQDFAALPLSFGDAVAQSRGYGVGWVLAHQNLGQLDVKTRAAVLANLRSRLVMQTTADDAAAFAREFAPHVERGDLQGLGPFEAYAAISTGAAVAPPVTLVTRPTPDPLGTAEKVRARSRDTYGVPPADVDAAIRKRILGDRLPAPVGGRRRVR